MHEGLDVCTGHAPAAKGAHEKLARCVATHASAGLLAREPGLDLGRKERALLGLGERHAHPLAVCDGLLEGRDELPALEALGQLEGGHAAGTLARGAGERQHATGHARDTQRAKGFPDLGRVERGELGVGELDVDGRVGANRGDLAGEQGVVDVGAQVLAHLALDLVGVGDDLVERAVLADEGARLLGADAGHAGDVVGRVALEAVEVWHELGRDAVVEVVDALGGHDVDVGDALAGGDDVHALGDELVHVAVASDKQHVVAGRLAAAGQGAQDVVALPALELGHGDVHVAQQLLDHGELLVQDRVHGRALRLVLGQHLHAHAGLALVERADDTVWLELLDELHEHRQEAVDGGGGAAVGRGHRGRNGVEGAVHERVAVDHGDGATGLAGSGRTGRVGACLGGVRCR